jgi:RNA polymerase sigma-70 factor (ECF subfamily)
MEDRPRDDERFGALMRAAQAGDGGAYRELLEAITPRVRQLVRRRRGFAGLEAVEDIVQDVLLSVHAVRATYDADRPFVPWLLAIVRHRLADHARQHFRRAAHEVAADDAGVTFEDVAANLRSEESADAEALAGAIRALPAGQRQAIELLKIKEMSLKEASVASGLSVGALKVATHRAMTSLRRALGKARDED